MIRDARAATERQVSYSHRDIPPFTMMMCIGAELSRLEPGRSLRIHEFGHTNSNGDERIASPYQRESTERAVRETIARLKLPYTVRRDGLDTVVEPVTAALVAAAKKQVAEMFNDEWT